MNSVALISTSLAKSARETVIVRKQCISYMFYVVVYSLILKVQELYCTYQARARSSRARRACALRALGLLLADGTPTGGRGEDFLSRQPNFFTETAVTPERKVEKWFPRWEINRHVEG